jgi:hemoglobin/transferrin/lactoferrin receptor protein
MQRVRPSASALLLGVSSIALATYGLSRATAQELEPEQLDPITVVSTKPIRQAAPPARRPAARRVSQRTTQTAAPRRPEPVVETEVGAAPAVVDPMPASDSVGAVSTVRQGQINQIQPTKTSDLLQGMPGVAVQERADDPGLAVNIRGLQDFGRVNVVIDGARQNFQRTGHNANGIFYLEPELISSIDVVRGPVANVFGSGAIGGVASFRTKDVEDVLKAGERWGVLAKGSFSTNTGAGASVFGAARISDDAEIFAGGTFRAQGNYRDGNGNTVPNTDSDVGTAIVKGTFRPADGHQIKLGYIHYGADYTTGQPYPDGTPPPFASIYATKTKNDIATGRWTYSRPDDRMFNFDANAYWSRTATDQTKIDGSGDAVSGLIGDSRNFTINTFGFDFNNTSLFDTGPVKHALTVGGDSFRDEVETSGFGVVFTPSGERVVSGAFMQLKSNFSNLIETVAAARYDSYSLDGGGFHSEGDRLSPKFTVALTAFNGITPYATYAEGYRAPAVTETLIAGPHPVQPTFTFLPNPGLAPEVGKTKEVGVNLRYDNVFQRGDTFRAKFNVYRNDIDNYIDMKFIPYTGPMGLCSGPPFCYQYQNIDKARVEGFEFETFYDAGTWFAGVAGALGTRGRNITDNLPLASIPTDQVTTTVGARFLDRKLTLAVRWQAVTAKDPKDIPPGAEAQGPSGPPYAFYPTSSFNLVNLYLGYQINPDALASLSVDNLFDQQYARYLNVSPSPNHGPGSTPLPFYSPGLTVKGSLTVRFTDKNWYDASWSRAN